MRLHLFTRKLPNSSSDFNWAGDLSTTSFEPQNTSSKLVGIQNTLLPQEFSWNILNKTKMLNLLDAIFGAGSVIPAVSLRSF